MSNTEPSRKGGRPAIDLEAAFTKIKFFLWLGYSLHKACLYGEVAYTTLKPYYDGDEGFRNKIDRARSFPNVAARATLISAIEQGDTKAALEWLQAMEKDEFSKRTEVKDVTEEASEELQLLREILDKNERTSQPVPPEQQTN